MRYILLNEGDIVCAGDEVIQEENCSTDIVYREVVKCHYGTGWPVGPNMCVRRKVDAGLEPMYETLFKLQEERVASERMAT